MRFYLFIILSFCTLLAKSQKIYGTVLSHDSIPLVGASVILYGQSIDSILAFDITDINGNWELPQKANAFEIHISYIGYKKVIKTIQHTTYSDNIVVYLTSEAFNLEKVTVSTKAFDITVSGDTLNYNISRYKTKTDTELEDLIRKLPGLEVSDNKQILYNGKRIDRVLVEGKEIFNNQHQLILESLQLNDVDGVQIIDQYRDFSERLSQDYSEKKALNLSLTSIAKDALNGNIELGAGYSQKFQGSSNLYKVEEEKGLSANLRSNNLGDPTISVSDFLNIQSSLLRTLNKTNGDLSKILPASIGIPEEAQSGTGNMVSFTFDKELKDSHSNKISLLSNLNTQKGSLDVNRIYFQTESVQNGKEKWSTFQPFINVGVNFSRLQKNNLSIEFDTPFSIELNNKEMTSIGFLDNLKTNTSFDQKKHSVIWSPYIYLSKKWSDKFTFKSSIGADIQLNEKNYYLQNDTNLFGSGKNQGFDYVTQIEVSPEINTTLTFLHNSFRFDWGLISSFERDQLTQNHDIFSYNNGFEILTQSLNISPSMSISYKTKRIRFNLMGILNHERQKVNKDRYSLNNISPSVLFKYNFNRFHFILLKANNGQKLIDPIYKTNLHQVISENSLQNYSLGQNKITSKSKSISMTHFWLDLYSQTRFYTILNYIKTFNPIYNSTEIQDNYYIYLPRIIDNIRNFSARTTISQRAFNSKLIVQGSIKYSSVINVSEFQHKITNYSGNFALQTNFDSRINFGLSYNYSKYQQQYQFLEQDFSSSSYSANFKFVQNKFRFSTKIGLYIRDNTKRSDFLKWDSDMEYLINTKYRLFLKAKDLFNLNQKLVTQSEISQHYIVLKEYIRFPGSIIIGGKLYY